jgi:hypothetical protein
VWKVDLATVIGAPTNPRVPTAAAEHPLADGESTVVEVLRRNPNAGAGAFEDTEPLRKRHDSADDNECKHDGDASTQARHGWIVVYADEVTQIPRTNHYREYRFIRAC